MSKRYRNLINHGSYEFPVKTQGPIFTVAKN